MDGDIEEIEQFLNQIELLVPEPVTPGPKTAEAASAEVILPDAPDLTFKLQYVGFNQVS